MIINELLQLKNSLLTSSWPDCLLGRGSAADLSPEYFLGFGCVLSVALSFTSIGR